jgi:hypothetical protein
MRSHRGIGLKVCPSHFGTRPLHGVISGAFPIRFIRIVGPTNGDVKAIVRVKKGGMSINPGPVNAKVMVLPIVRKTKRLGAVA